MQSDGSPANLAAWFIIWRTWFTVAAPTPIPLHRHQLMNFIRLKLDKGCESELRYRINWEKDLMPDMERVMKDKKKKNYPDTTMTTNLFSMQGLKPGESYSDLLRRVEEAVEFCGVGTREVFTLTYDKFIVIIMTFLLPTSSQKVICDKFNTTQISLVELRKWCAGQTMWTSWIKDGNWN